MEIQLTFRKEDFREIYFRKNNGHWLFNQTTKQSAIFLMLSLLGLSLSIFIPNKQTFSLAITLLLFVILVIDFALKFNTYYKWRKHIEDFLDTQDKYEKYKLEISAQYLTLALDDVITIEKLDQIKLAEFNNQFISLTGSTTYLIPRKSMTDIEFENLTIMLKDNIKNSQ
jgi:hypothetical protein